jgi:hypothetical protein
LVSEEVSATIFTVEPLLIMDISSGSRLSVAVLELLLIILNYQQRYIYNGSKTTSDDSLKLLQMIFSIIMYVHSCMWCNCPSEEQEYIHIPHHRCICIGPNSSMLHAYLH